MSDLIRSARRRAGLTGTELADRLGVSVAAVSQMERSERDGRIQIHTLERALDAMGERLQFAAKPQSPLDAYAPESVTKELNKALDSRDTAFALRLLTRAASVVRENAHSFEQAELEYRPSELADRRWEQLFRALYGDALPAERRPTWALPERLDRRWYVSQFAPLRERAKESTPQRLRELNIFIDERSLTRA